MLREDGVQYRGAIAAVISATGVYAGAGAGLTAGGLTGPVLA